jgi:hypothetical protein
MSEEPKPKDTRTTEEKRRDARASYYKGWMADQTSISFPDWVCSIPEPMHAVGHLLFNLDMMSTRVQ